MENETKIHPSLSLATALVMQHKENESTLMNEIAKSLREVYLLGYEQGQKDLKEAK